MRITITINTINAAFGDLGSPYQFADLAYQLKATLGSARGFAVESSQRVESGSRALYDLNGNCCGEIDCKLERGIDHE